MNVMLERERCERTDEVLMKCPPRLVGPPSGARDYGGGGMPRRARRAGCSHSAQMGVGVRIALLADGSPMLNKQWQLCAWHLMYDALLFVHGQDVVERECRLVPPAGGLLHHAG